MAFGAGEGTCSGRTTWAAVPGDANVTAGRSALKALLRYTFLCLLRAHSLGKSKAAGDGKLRTPTYVDFTRDDTEITITKWDLPDTAQVGQQRLRLVVHARDVQVQGLCGKRRAGDYENRA